MKTHTTNYFDTFIEVAEDTKATTGTRPPAKAQKTVAEMQYELLRHHPYRYTSDDILFKVFAIRNDLSKSEYAAAQHEFFSKGQACLRTSPLAKTYGFGIHCNSEGKVAIYGMETPEYQAYVSNKSLTKLKAMRSKR